jgi:hypothetical protein
MADHALFEDEVTGPTLDLLSPTSAPDIDHALARHRTLLATARVIPSEPRRSLLGTLLGGLSVARRPLPTIPIAVLALFSLSLLTPPAQTLAGRFLSIFRVQDFQPITVSQQSLYGVPDLTKFGDMSPTRPFNGAPQTVSGIPAASAAVDFSVKAPAQLPAGVAAQPSRVAVTPAQTASFTFRSAKARAYLDSIGNSTFNLPPKFDGASIQVNVPAVAIMTFSPPGTNVPSSRSEAQSREAMDAILNSVTIIEAKAPTVDASGVSFEELRDFLLSLPGLPPETAAQIRAIGNLDSTLPIPIPTGAQARKIQVNGQPGLIVAEQASRLAGGIVWQTGGIVYAVGGALNEADLLSIATSVR